MFSVAYLLFALMRCCYPFYNTTEAEYAFTLHKDIVPLMMESNYRPDGWLGIIMGSKLWIDFSSGQNIRDSVEKLKKELGTRGKGESAAKKGDKWK